jgi:general secretion pathway protein E
VARFFPWAATDRRIPFTIRNPTMETTTIDGPVALLPGWVGRDFLLRHRICPLEVPADGPVRVAVGPSYRPDGLDDLAVVYGRPLAIEPVEDLDLEASIERVVATSEQAVQLEPGAAVTDSSASDMRELANQPPVVRYLNLLVRDAFEARASDIHMEAGPDGLQVRFRVDGVLVPALAPPPDLGRAVVSRTKLLGNLDIAERRRPQDGRIRVRLESREIDLRISTVPTMYGESVVVRLLDPSGTASALGDLGFPKPVLAGVLELASRPHGLVLAVGPTGSGKTTTLHAALAIRDSSREKIITIEDPVEYVLPGVIQVPVHPLAGVTFHSMLRSILRHDPDVVMVGEMRDPETAEIAVRAALTGHLVLSTLHTSGALGAIPRLLELGIPRYLVAATLDGVVAQRLVRQVCSACREVAEPEHHQLSALGLLSAEGSRSSGFARGRGCAACRGTGYRGRTGIFELLVVTHQTRDAVTAAAPQAELERLARDAGFTPLVCDALDKARAGITTIEEVLRVMVT